jgi:hypothetical protein
MNLDIDTGDSVNFLVSHDVRLPEIVRANDDAFALKLFASSR